MIFRVRSRRAIALAGLVLLANVPAPAEVIWTGLGVNTSWTTGANWQGGTAPLNDGTQQVLFGTSAQSVVVVDTPQSVLRLRFDYSIDGVRAYSLSGLGGSTLTLGSEGLQVI